MIKYWPKKSKFYGLCADSILFSYLKFQASAFPAPSGTHLVPAPPDFPPLLLETESFEMCSYSLLSGLTFSVAHYTIIDFNFDSTIASVKREP